MLFVESSMYLTYYRDCIFALTVFALYIGMLWVNLEFRWYISDYDVGSSSVYQYKSRMKLGVKSIEFASQYLSDYSNKTD